jgi:hypothetical protein
VKIYVAAVEALRRSGKKEIQGETQENDGFLSFTPH